MPQSALAFSSTVELGPSHPPPPLVTTQYCPLSCVSTRQPLTPPSDFFSLAQPNRPQSSHSRIDVSVGDLPETTIMCRQIYSFLSSSILLLPHLADLALNLSPSLPPWDSSCHINRESMPTPFTTMPPTLCSIIHLIHHAFHITNPSLTCTTSSLVPSVPFSCEPLSPRLSHHSIFSTKLGMV